MYSATGTAKMLCVVKWNGLLSRVFSVGSGVRQGSCLSPAPASEMTYIVSGRALNSTHSLVACNF